MRVRGATMESLTSLKWRKVSLKLERVELVVGVSDGDPVCALVGDLVGALVVAPPAAAQVKSLSKPDTVHITLARKTVSSSPVRLARVQFPYHRCTRP